jgi:hypothetical protein
MRLGAARYGDSAVVGRGDGFGGSATDAMFAVGTEVEAVIGGGFDRIAGVEGWPVRRHRVRRAVVSGPVAPTSRGASSYH